MLRFWSEGENPRHAGFIGRLRFLTRFITIADVLAFLPELIVLLFVSGSARRLASRRCGRCACSALFKLARYVPAFAIVGAAVRRAGAPLMAALCVAGAQLYYRAMLLYFIEGERNPQSFGSITRAMWWAVVTLTTVGYGDVYPRLCWGALSRDLWR